MGCSQSSQHHSGEGTIEQHQKKPKKKVSVATDVTICLPEECDSSKETPSCGGSDCDKGFTVVEKFSLVQLDEEPTSPLEQKKPRRNRRRRSAELSQSASPTVRSPRGTLTNPLGAGSWHGLGGEPEASLSVGDTGKANSSQGQGGGGGVASISPTSQSLSATTCTATTSHTTTAAQSMSFNPMTASGELSSHSVLGLIAGSAAANSGDDAHHPIPGVTGLTTAFPAMNNSNGSNNLSGSTGHFFIGDGSSSMNSNSVNAGFPNGFSASMSTNCPPRKNSASIQLGAGGIPSMSSPMTPKSAAVIVTQTQVVDHTDDLMTQRSQDWAKSHVDTEFNKSSFCVKSPIEAGMNSPRNGKSLQRRQAPPQGLGSPIVVASSGTVGQVGLGDTIESVMEDATSPLLGRSIKSVTSADESSILPEVASQDC